MTTPSGFADDGAFRRAVTQTLDFLLDQVDEIDADIDPRLIPGNLSVVFEDDDSTFVLSQQTPTHELWLSANLRAWHFRWSSGAWIERDTAEDMHQLLSRLFSEKLGMDIRLEAGD